jgi:hypothetical protein
MWSIRKIHLLAVTQPASTCRGSRLTRVSNDQISCTNVCKYFLNSSSFMPLKSAQRYYID